MKYLKLIITIPAVCFLLGCTIGSNYSQPDPNISEEWAYNNLSSTSAESINVEWWTLFNDPLLTKYINKAIINNKDILITIENLNKERFLRRESTARLFPQLDAYFNGERRKSSEALSSFTSGQIRNTFDAGFDASWEIDIFGARRKEIELADARIDSALEDYNAALLSALSDTARIYYEIRGVQKQILITEKNINLFNETYELIKARYEVGESSEFDLSRARGEYQLTSARIPNLKADLYAAIFQLSILTGHPPETHLEEILDSQPLPAPPDIVPIGLRSEILKRRPDIRKAEKESALAFAEIGVESAELFPKFFITGDIGSAALLFGDLFSSTGRIWSFGSMIQWSIFQSGAIQSRIDAARSNSKAKILEYEKTVLEALSDVETALTRYGQELETRRLLEKAVNSRRQSVKLAKNLFHAGEEDYLAVLDTERELTNSENELVISETKTITNLIALYTALGGGWQTVNVLESKDH